MTPIERDIVDLAQWLTAALIIMVLPQLLRGIYLAQQEAGRDESEGEE